MTRFDALRTSVIETFFSVLTGQQDFAGLREPAELFRADGSFDLTFDALGLVRVPTPRGLQKRIDAAPAGPQKEGLERFKRILEATLVDLFGALPAGASAENRLKFLAGLAPMVRHPDGQTFWPVDVAALLGLDDGLLQGRAYGPSGGTPLGPQLAEKLLEELGGVAPTVTPGDPYASRVPFVATIATEPGTPRFPTAPLSDGRLALTAAEDRLGPSKLAPTVYVEIKVLGSAMRMSRRLLSRAGAGRLAGLRHLRLLKDPIGREITDQGRTDADQLLLIIYHAFYPADDGARRVGDGTGTNREFHHLAVGRLQTLTPTRVSTELLFLGAPGNQVQLLPARHPAVERLNAAGQQQRGGSHPVIYAGTSSPQSYQFKADTKTTAKSGLDYNPDQAEWWIGIGSAIVTGAGIGAIGGPVGAGIGAAVGAVVFFLAWLLKKLFGGKKDRQKEWTEQQPWPGEPPLVTYKNGARNHIGPPGTDVASGGAHPGRAYKLVLIPHHPDDNLWGLDFLGADTCRLVDDTDRREMLAWLGFEGGFGYQFQRPIPGRSDVAGASLQNYFQLFSERLTQLQAAGADVEFFGEA